MTCLSLDSLQCAERLSCFSTIRMSAKPKGSLVMTRAALSALLFLVIALLSVLSIWLAGAFFNFLTGEMNELEEIEKGNIAVALLFAFVLFAVTMLLNQGIEEVARALVPYSMSGVRLP